VRFAVGFSPSTSVTREEVARKYGVPASYAITPNQFWPHKNHHLLVRAFAASRFPGQLLLTGAPKSERDPDYLPSLERLIVELGVVDRVRCLGQLPRDEQLALLKYADVVVQPSLFEGWSTLVEECKALGKFLIVSDLPVHREQISENCWFFDPHDQTELTRRLDQFADEKPVPEPIDYDVHRRRFAESLMSIIEAT
jgi:glycosyltransferase involved in cell wall biosynthesis